MGKQAFDRRVALANALSSSGVAVVPPPKAAPKENNSGKGKGAGRRKKEPSPEPAPKSKKEIEEEQRKLLEENEKQRKAFFEAEAAKKLQERKGADAGVTYVEDRDSRKPVAVSDISEYWRSDLGMLPFMPDDNVGPVEVPEGVDVHERLEYLQMLSEQLQQVLKMRFHVFWSQVIYDPQLRRCLDSYLRFSLRAHDVEESAGGAAATNASQDPMAVEERKVAGEISRRVLAVFLRLSRPQETSHDFISDAKFGELIYEHRIFDVPKLVDLCSIYGDSNRSTVTKIVHSVFLYQPKCKEDFKAVVQHMLGGLHQCCSPLQDLLAGDETRQQQKKAGRGKSPELSIDECLAFLPDILSCFNAIFCFFPEECVELLIGGSLDGGLPLADLMVVLHESVTTLQQRSGRGSSDHLSSVCRTIVSFLSRLLSCVLGFRMAPRHGASAFDDLLEWLKTQVDRSALLSDLGKHGLENVAMDWLASGLVDDAQLDYLEQLCGPLLPKEARARRRNHPSAPSKGGATGSSGGAVSSGAASSDAAKIREVREVVGMEFGEGFVLQCLLHYGNSVPAVVGAIFDGSLPPQLSALPISLGLHQDPSAALASKPGEAKLSSADKARVVEQASRMDREATEASAEAAAAGEYDDDFDDGDLVPGFRIGGNQGSDSEASEDSRASSSEEEGAGSSRWPGGKGGHKGGGKGKFKGPVQGQTIQARRKEENKAKVANHNRR
eukprot:CAMPEP_0179104658 /NCGR_PEP_ID=MMETSP0796-20121207/48563_1 /TAXON_ID=73915 /ORGANISM="Pyrodinium bahamense, Strain pbaha01" /LENGTH=723 /DNA_ID=CAMNT_0020802615 /DNA_START=44 /DNA_END=2211 /DNA_ORIENTATION=-